MGNPRTLLLLTFAIGCGGAAADILDASDDVTSSADASDPGDASASDVTDASSSDVVDGAVLDASKEADAAPPCTPLKDSGTTATSSPAVGCQCIEQLNGCTLAKPGADCRWFVENSGGNCTTDCLFSPVPDSGACELCAETYNCACIAPTLTGQFAGVKCVDSDAGPYLTK